jgi:hypothetical protein
MRFLKKDCLSNIENAVLFFFLFNVAFAYVIKKLMNTGLFLASFYAVFWILLNRPKWQNLDKNIKTLFILLCIPITLAIGFELFRTPKYMAVLDEYSRLLLAAPILVWLYHRLENRHWRFFQTAFALSFPALIFLDFKWIDLGQTAWTRDTRFATYFIEPNTAGLIAVIGTAALTSWALNCKKNALIRSVFGICAVAAAYILYDSETRIAWLAMCAVVGCMLLFHNPSKRIFITKLLVVCLAFAAALQTPSVQTRIAQAKKDLVLWENGTNFNTSLGLRLNIYLGITELTNRQFFKGHSLSEVKTIQQAPYPVNPITDPDARRMWIHSGIHNHFLEKFLTHGILGLLVSLALFSLPAMWAYRSKPKDLNTNTHSHDSYNSYLNTYNDSPSNTKNSKITDDSHDTDDAKMLVIWLCLSYFVCSLALILTLKFMNSFFATVLVIAFAQMFGIRRQQGFTENGEQ